ncbi:armadillo-type protein [Paraphysoderma sedebokerense]|nr:armadillo-type protein [Paraphysoderma sedebokerense]
MLGPMSNSPMEMIHTLLRNVLHPDQAQRKSAESNLNALKSQKEFPVALANLALTSTIDTTTRQVAAYTLKRYIETNWSPKNENFEGPELDTETKLFIRNQIVTQGLLDENSKMRVACAYAVAKIAHSDWPEEWPDLFNILLTHLQSGNAIAVHSSMRVLSDFISSDVTDQQLPQIAPLLLPQLLKVFTKPEIYSPTIRCRAVNILKDVIECLSTLKDNPEVQVENFVGPVISEWATAFIDVMKVGFANVTEDQLNQMILLKYTISKTLTQFHSCFPKQLGPHLMTIFEIIFGDLDTLRSVYVSRKVLGSDDTDSDGEASDGEEISIDNLLYIYFDFVSAVMRVSKLAPIFIGSNQLSTAKSRSKRHILPLESHPVALSGGILSQLYYNVIVYMQMTQYQESEWLDNPNEFVVDEMDYDSFKYNVRIAASDLILSGIDYFSETAIRCLASASMKALEESAQMKKDGKSRWWKLQDAALLAIGRAHEEIASLLSQGNAIIDMSVIFGQILVEAMQNSALPFLQGRALWFAGQFASIMPLDHASQYVNLSVQALDPQQTVPVRLSALKALKGFSDSIDKAYLNSVQAAILQRVTPLVHFATEDTLILILETLISVVKIDPNVTLQHESLIIPAIIEIWSKNVEDHLINGLVLDIVDTLSSLPPLVPALYSRLLPVIVSIIQSPEQQPSQTVPATAVDLLTCLVRYSPTPFPSSLVNEAFPCLIKLLLHTTDHSILQNGEECLKLFVQRDFQSMASWKDSASGKGSIELIIEFLARMLDPGQSESASLFVGQLIVQLILKGGDRLMPVLPALLTAVVTRLETAKTGSFVQSLVLVFAHLIRKQMATVIDFLSGTKIHSRSGLEVLIHSWIDHHEVFQGFYNIKVSIAALIELFRSGHSNLNSIMVKGDLIVPNSGRILTRSRSKNTPDQFTVIPFPAKILKLLYNDLVQNIEQQQPQELQGLDESTGNDLSEFDGDSDGWEDLEEEKTPMDEYNYLSGFIDAGEELDDDIGDDPDVLADPLYQTKTSTLLLDFFKSALPANINAVNGYIDQFFKDEEKKTLLALLQK